MKKLILILTAVASLLVAGCNQGGTSDQYNSNSGHTNSLGGTNAH
jgi:hypothetical protein